MANTKIIDCTTCKYGYEDERLGIPMCHHPRRFSEDCVDFNMHEEKEIKESEKPSAKDAMKELDEKIALVKLRGTWDGVDVDKYMDEVRGREPEKPINLEEEVKRYYSDNFAYISSDQPTLSILTNIARHFAEWGYLRAAEKYNEIEYNRQRAEESVPNDLQEAANEHVNNIAYCGDDIELEKEQSKRDFIAGAKWQAEKDARDMYMSDNRHFEKVYQLGKKDMKEQMMKEAVDADVMLTLHDKTGDISLHTGYLPKELGIKCDDKVKIIIVKEEN